jgi:hypothetical protein
MPNFLTTASQLMCPHGGTVSATTQNSQAKAGGDFIVCSSDQFQIAGCPFMLGPNPHPCMQIQWLVPTTMDKACQNSALSDSSVGLCVAADQVPQGAPQVTQTQAKGSGQ